MSIATRCPHCSTLFRVTPRDLQARHGEVRCGRCMTVFDGFKTLVTLPEPPTGDALPRGAAPDPGPPRAPPAVVEAPASPAPVAGAHEVVADPVVVDPVVEPAATAPAAPDFAVAQPAAAEAEAHEPFTAPEPDPASDTTAIASGQVTEPTALVAGLADAEPASPEPATAVADAPAPLELEKPPVDLLGDPLASEPPLSAAENSADFSGERAAVTAAPVPTRYRSDATFLDEVEPEPEAEPRRRAWIAGALLLLVALGAQAVYVFRGELAARVPELKPVLFEVCRTLRCEVPLPQRPKLINIEASDLQIPDTAKPSVIQLTATLRNHAGYDVGYPALDLVLTNKNDHPAARRIFLPAEYLDRGRDPRAGLAANAELTIRLDLDTGDLGAAGFRLDLLPAP